MEILEENKLLELLEAVESVLEHEDAEQILDADTLGQFAEIQKLILAWLSSESALTHAQRLEMLVDFTNNLAQSKLVLDRNATPLH